MLQYLKISNLALLDEASIEFEGGFNVVTGETGAGKSVILGALSLLSGSRGDKSLIRSGEEVCEVEAGVWLQDSAAADAALEKIDLPVCEEGMLRLRRSLYSAKPSRISINGRMATLANLQRLGELWIDFHGPGEPQRLLKNACQLELIDLYAKLDGDVAKYRERYRQWQDVLGHIDRLQGSSRLSTEQIDFLRLQLESMDQLELTEDAINQLETDFNRVSSSQELLEQTRGIAGGINQDGGVLGQLGPLTLAAKEAASLDPSLAELAARLDGLIVELQELGSEYEDVGSSLDFEPEQVARIEQQMTTWQDLRRKHGRDVESVLQAKQEMETRLGEQGNVEGNLERLNDEADELARELKGLASRLTQKRKQAGQKLAKEAENMLLGLGFKKARCAVEMLSEKGLKPYGDALPELQFSPNVGEPLQPLAKIASSGELARVMLALKSILAKVDSIPVLVFDEVDANVGGEIGREVGLKMRAISQGRQVFCITHLPQVAGFGESHFQVIKDQSGNRAKVSISQLETKSDDRVEELARMLGDRKATSALSHARELLEV